MKLLLSTIMLALLAGCGSSPANTQDAPVASVSGKAVANTVTSGIVFLKDSANHEISTPTAVDGSFYLNTTGMQKPYLMKAVFSNNSTLYSIVNDNGVVTIDNTTNWIANLAATGLRLAEVYLFIRGELLILLANIAGSIADSLNTKP